VLQILDEAQGQAMVPAEEVSFYSYSCRRDDSNWKELAMGS